MTSAVEVLMGVSSFLGLGFMFITYNPDTPALQLLHNNSYTTPFSHVSRIKFDSRRPPFILNH
jgi:hypothetical protein